MKYNRNPLTIEAHQWFPPEVWPVEYPCFDPRPEFNKSVAFKEQNVAILYTINQDHKVVIEAGDYIVPEPDGQHFYLVKQDIFESNYTKFENEQDTIVGFITYKLKFDEKNYQIQWDLNPEHETAAIAIAREIVKNVKATAIANIDNFKGKQKEMFKDRANRMTHAEYALTLIVESMIMDRIIDRENKLKPIENELEAK